MGFDMKDNNIDLVDFGLKQIQNGLVKKDFTAVEVVNSYISRIQKAESKKLNCFITETFDRAISDAKNTDERVLKGEKLLPLDGAVLAMKDLFCTKGILTTASSKILNNFIPQYESTVSGKLAKAGSSLIGKTSMDEFAMGGSNKTSFFGPVINPYHDVTRPDMPLVPGGSSGGSAASVAAGLSLMATASDTGGSVRQPASFCGIVGIKPTYGRVSRYGCIAFASSLDTPSVMARSVYDVTVMLQVVSGYDEKDSTSYNSKVPDWVISIDNVKDDLTGLRVGLPKEYFENLSPELMGLMQKRIDDMESLGAEVIDVTLPSTKYALPVYYIIAPAEASSNLSRYDGVRYGFRADGEFESLDDMYFKTRSEGFGDEVKRRLMIGTAVLSSGFYDAYFMRAAKVRRIIQNEFIDTFKKVDVLLTPTTTGGAFGMSDVLTPIEMYMNDVFTVGCNLAGVPAINIPAGIDERTKLPLGLQLIGKMYDEETILKVAKIMENIINFDNRPSKFF